MAAGMYRNQPNNPFAEYAGSMPLVGSVPENRFNPLQMNTGIPMYSGGGGVGGLGQTGMTGTSVQQQLSPDMQLRAIIELLRRMGM